MTTDNDFMRFKSPIRLFEYWAYGKPVISTSLGEAGYYIVDGENGLVADTRDHMEATFAQLAGDAGLRTRVGREGQRRVLEKWSQDAVCRCYADILGVPAQ